MKISRTKRASVAAASSIEATPSHSTLTPKGTEMSAYSSAITRAMAIERDGLDLGQIGQAELVREHDRVDAAVLQREQVGPGPLDDSRKAGPLVVVGIARQGREVAHADDGFLDAEDLVEPAQVDHP